MKIPLAPCFTLIGLFTPCLFAPMAQAQCTPSPSGLVAWWKAEGNANDAVGVSHGTLYNGATATTAGKVGQSFYFDGVDDRITVPDTAALRFDRSFSVEGWILPSKNPATGQKGMILFRGDNRGGFDPYFLQHNPDGRIDFYISSLTESHEVLSATALPLNQFSHIAATLDDATGEMKFYINGNLSNSSVTTARPFRDLDPGSNPSIGIGNHGGFPNTSYNYPFAGYIDELSLYNRALTAAEVRNIYNAGSGGKCMKVPYIAVNNPRSLPEGNAGAPGSVTFDITLDAPITQTVTVNCQTTNGNTNPAIAGSDYVAKSGNLTFAPGETLKKVTISFIGDSTVELNETFFFDLKTPTNATIADSRGVGQINNDDGPGITIANAAAVNEGSSGTTPQTFAVTLSAASANTVTVNWATANGTATTADYVAASGTLTFAPGQTSKLITIQVNGDTQPEPNETYKVVLSKVAYAFIADGTGIGTIHNDDVAEAQCTPSPSGLVAWWKAENNGLDSVGGATGTLYNGTAYAAGKVGQAFSFDGVDDRISVPDAEALHFTGTFSIEAWVAPSKYPDAGRVTAILFRGDNRDARDPYVMLLYPDGRVSFEIESDTTQVIIKSTDPIPLNVFSHIVATMDDGTGEMRLYVNGSLSSSITTAVRPLRDLDPAQGAGIGIGNTGGFPNTSYNYPFAGYIDELSLYNRALTATEVKNIYDAGSSGKCIPGITISNSTVNQDEPSQ